MHAVFPSSERGPKSAYWPGLMAPAASATVTAEVLVQFLAISTRMVSKLAVAGLVVRAGPNAFDLEASIRNVVLDLRRAARGRGDVSTAAQAARERAQLAAARADSVELKSAHQRGRLLDSDAVEKEWSGICAAVRSRMLAVPSRCVRRLPHLTAHDIAQVDRLPPRNCLPVCIAAAVSRIRTTTVRTRAIRLAM